LWGSWSSVGSVKVVTEDGHGGETIKKPFTGALRVLLEGLVVVVGLGLLAVPPIVLAVSGSNWTEALWSTLRLAALEAFTLVFIDIVTGSFRPFFVRVYKGRLVQRAHMIIALTGFSVGIAHGVMAFLYGVSGYARAAAWIGPIVLLVLVIVIVTALSRRRLRRSWRWVHRLNYAIFAAVMTHGLILGYDLRNETFLKVWFGLYAAVVAAGLAYRVSTQLRRGDGGARG
jgi:hypothetical protein